MNKTEFKAAIDSRIATLQSGINADYVALDCSSSPPLKKLGLIGDSITAGGNWPVLLNRSNTMNFGIPGNTTGQMLSRVSTLYGQGLDIVFIMGGLNDLEAGVPPSTIGHNLIDIAGNLRANGVTLPVILSTFKVTTARSGSGNLNSGIDQVNSYLAPNAAANMIDYLDLNTVYMAPSGVLQAEYTTDGAHLTAAGYDKWTFCLNYWLAKHGY